MDHDYKTVAEQLSFELIDIQTSLDSTSNEIDALLQTLIGIKILTPEQLTRRRESWWEGKAKQVVNTPVSRP